MEQVLTQTKVNPIVKTLAVGSVVTLSVAAIYYGLCMINPSLAQSTLRFVFGKSIRTANLLRPLVLFNPFAALGMFFGSVQFDASTGNPAMFLDVLGWMNVALGVGIWKLSKVWGRSLIKDIALVTLYAVANAILMSVNLSAVAVLFYNVSRFDISKMFGEIVLFKVWTKIALFNAGLPLLYAVEGAVNGIKEKYEAGFTSK